MPATSGEPGTQVAAEAPEPEPRRNPRARISGRVVDEQGRPVSGITVRLADGGARGGKDIRATTDRSGAFTLNGLRPGSAYSLVAESDDERGHLSGRAEAEASQTGVEISLVGEDEANSPRGRSGRASRARPISSREESEQAPGDEESESINREDIRPPDEAGDPDPDRGPSTSRPRLSAPEPSVGWRKQGTSKPADLSEGDVESVASSASDETASRPARPSATETDLEDDGQNPLPPAIDRRREAPPDGEDSPPQTSAQPNPRRRVSDRSAAPAGDLEKLALAPEAPEDRQSPSETRIGDPGRKIAAAELPKMPPILPQAASPPNSIEVAGGPSIESGPDLSGQSGPDPTPAVASVPIANPPPIASVDPPGLTPSPPSGASISQAASRIIPASRPVFASTPPNVEAVPPPPVDPEYNPFLLVSHEASRPAPIAPPEKPAESLSPAIEPETSTTPPRKKWGELAAVNAPNAAVEPARPTSSLRKRIRATADRKDVSLSLCSYDARLRKVVDFRLPDLEGKPVRFQDLDADFILLDFWGTWCAPCLEAIPHLVALQKEYGPRRLRVVGIACERVTPEQRKARVDEVSRRLGINYAILLSGMDGKPCPVQESLQIQVYPTTVLLDRTGRVLWRNSGATPATQDRLDRVLAGLSRSETVRR